MRDRKASRKQRRSGDVELVVATPAGADVSGIDSAHNPQTTKIVFPFSIGIGSEWKNESSVAETQIKAGIRARLRYAIKNGLDKIVLFGADKCQVPLFQMHDADFYRSNRRDRNPEEAAQKAQALGDTWERLCRDVLQEDEFARADNLTIEIKRWDDMPYDDADIAKVRDALSQDDEFAGKFANHDGGRVNRQVGYAIAMAKEVQNEASTEPDWDSLEGELKEKYKVLSDGYSINEHAQFTTWGRHLCEVSGADMHWLFDGEEPSKIERLLIRYVGELSEDNSMLYLAKEKQLLQAGVAVDFVGMKVIARRNSGLSATSSVMSDSSCSSSISDADRSATGTAGSSAPSAETQGADVLSFDVAAKSEAQDHPESPPPEAANAANVVPLQQATEQHGGSTGSLGEHGEEGVKKHHSPPQEDLDRFVAAWTQMMKFAGANPTSRAQLTAAWVQFADTLSDSPKSSRSSSPGVGENQQGTANGLFSNPANPAARPSSGQAQQAQAVAGAQRTSMQKQAVTGAQRASTLK